MREISHHILDIARNSIEAGASELTVTVAEDRAHDLLTVTVADNGRGMTEEEAAVAADSRFTSRNTRRWGLGLPLFRATCERCEGGLDIASAPGMGTTVTCRLLLSHVDRPPLGDMGAVMQALLCEARTRHIRYRHEVSGLCFVLDSQQIQVELEDVDVCHPLVLDWIRGYVNQSLRDFGSRA